jgi:hypothetical protein
MARFLADLFAEAKGTSGSSREAESIDAPERGRDRPEPQGEPEKSSER